jgi:UDP-N-acetylmuramate--alanine ligase
VTYGMGESADVRAVKVRRDGARTHFRALRRGQEALEVTVNLAGMHNVLNSLAAIAVATDLAISDSAIQRALEKFQGIDRRLQVVGEVAWPGTPSAGITGAGITVVDDYGHHPTEIAATLDALRQAYAGRRIVLVFQPHRYSRTRDLMDDFARVLAGAETLLVTEVYAAGEAPIEGATHEALADGLQARGHRNVYRMDVPEQLPGLVAEIARPGDIVICLGAGTITQWAYALPGQLAELETKAATG